MKKEAKKISRDPRIYLKQTKQKLSSSKTNENPSVIAKKSN